MAVFSLHIYCAPESELYRAVQPMCKAVRNRRECAYVLLSAVGSVSSKWAHLFMPYARDFFVMEVDPTYNRRVKLDVLANICCSSNIHSILREFEAYVRSPNEDFVCEVINTIGAFCVSVCVCVCVCAVA
jgi:AP-3 complex subunit beta